MDRYPADLENHKKSTELLKEIEAYLSFRITPDIENMRKMKADIVKHLSEIDEEEKEPLSSDSNKRRRITDREPISFGVVPPGRGSGSPRECEHAEIMAELRRTRECVNEILRRINTRSSV